MSGLKKWALKITNGFYDLQRVRIERLLHLQPEKIRLRSARAVGEKSLQEQLKKQQQALEHEISLMKAQHQSELAMFEIKCQHDIKDYSDYLDSLDRLKLSVTEKYRELPEALALTIHHHAKRLLDEMWEADDFRQKTTLELRFIQFLAVINDDILAATEADTPHRLPLKTLALLQNAPRTANETHPDH